MKIKEFAKKYKQYTIDMLNMIGGEKKYEPYY